MASYIPASYAGRDFATRPAAHDQLWSNDDCLSSHFITDGRKSIKTLRDEMASERPAQGSKPAKPAMSEAEIDARIKQIKAARKDKDKKRKANKAARAAAGQGGAHLQSKAIRDKKLELTNVDEKFAQLKKEKVFKGQTITQQEEDEYKATKELLEVQLRKLEIKEQPYAGQGGNASGKQKKKHVKLSLSPDLQDELKEMVSKHAKAVRNALEVAIDHEDYSVKLHKELESFALNKLNLYDRLPDSPTKPAKVAILQKIYDKIKDTPVDKTIWDAPVFNEFKDIMHEYRDEVDAMRSQSHTSKERRDMRKGFLQTRSKKILALLEKNNIMQREKVRADR